MLECGTVCPACIQERKPGGTCWRPREGPGFRCHLRLPGLEDMSPDLARPLIGLASASPRRRELLGLTGWAVSNLPAGVDEVPLAGETAEVLARRLALAKARAAAASPDGLAVTLGADTIVVDGGRMMGKPADAAEAAEMLERLRGGTHRVLTALALVDPRRGTELVELCETAVPMRDYTRDEVAGYVASGSPLDKAGAYGIQDGGFQPVALERLEGCFANVMGLPLCHLVRGMRRLGHVPPADVPTACQEHTAYACRVFDRILREEV